MRASRSASKWFATGVRTAVLGLACAVTVGCQPPTPPPKPAPRVAPPTPTAAQAMTTQEQFAALDPKAKVGRVDAVNAASHMAAVSGIDPADVKPDATVSFIGPDRRPIANGSVVSIDTKGATPYLIVTYSKASPDGRDPIEGELAITIPIDGGK